MQQPDHSKHKHKRMSHAGVKNKHDLAETLQAIRLLLEWQEQLVCFAMQQLGLPAAGGRQRSALKRRRERKGSARRS